MGPARPHLHDASPAFSPEKVLPFMSLRLLAACAVLLLGLGDLSQIARWIGFDGDAADAGRRGNAFYQQENYGEAAGAYRTGLQRHREAASDSGAVYVALQNNLGAALHRQEKFSAARSAFDAAHRIASTRDERVRALYNAGNAAAGMGDLEAALRYFRKALLQNPNFQPARHNFEMLKRQMQKRQEQKRGGSPPDVEPSPFAKELKRRADALVARKQYGNALTLMEDGLAQDSTVRAYRRFMERLEDVNGILQEGAPRTAPGANPIQTQ
jgi:tetratricopeptide (TPR) repeat protein